MKLFYKKWLQIVFESTTTDIYVGGISAYANHHIFYDYI